MFNSRKTLIFVHFIVVSHLAAALCAAAPRRPNLVLLIGDDHGWPYSGFMGHPTVQTPNLDALAAAGTTFINAQNPASICQPTLRGLLAGVHDEQWGRRRSNLEQLLGKLPPRTEVAYYRTVPRELVRQGYLAWEGGKLWEGTFATAGFSHGLATFLFPSWFRSAGDQFGREGWSTGTALAPLEEFLDEAHGQPFFLWLAPLLPHVPYDAPAEFTRLYEGRESPQVARYFANVTWLDAVVGRVVEALERRGLRDDTLIVYLSDNGKEPAQDMAGVGTGKGTLYELGFRTPLVVSWPGHVPPGVVRDDLVSTLDVPATLLDYAGADAIEDLEGRSLRGAIEQGDEVGRPRLVGRYRSPHPASNGYWVRTPQWRYLVAADGREELHAIAVDPFERADVAPAHPDVVRRFRADVVAWQQRVEAGRRTVDVAGRVTGPRGEPAPGEALELAGRTSTGRAIRLRVLTSAAGDYLFEAVPQGSYVLTSRRRGAGLSLGSIRDRIPVLLPAGSIDSYLPLQVEHASHPFAGSAAIAGVVRDRDGEPVAGADVRLRAVGSAASMTVVVRTGRDGRFRAEHLPAGTYRVVADGRRLRVEGRTTVGPGELRALDLARPGVRDLATRAVSVDDPA